MKLMIAIYAQHEIEGLRRAGSAAASTLALVGARIHEGVTTADIDSWVREHTTALGGRPSQLGYHGFPAAVCTSRNAVVCHGIPRADEVLEPGDIVNVDVTTTLGGFHGDTSATFVIGGASAQARALVDIARACRDAGIAVVRDGARLGDIGAAIEERARASGVSVVREYGGHGIGRQMHMAPHVPHVGRRGAGPRLRVGMALTIEPMINAGGAAVRTLADGWTVVTVDGSLSAQFEHTVIVTRDGCEITTLEPSRLAADPRTSTFEPSRLAADPRTSTFEPSRLAADPQTSTFEPSRLAADPATRDVSAPAPHPSKTHPSSPGQA